MNNEEIIVKGKLSDDFSTIVIENPYILSRVASFLKGQPLEITIKKFYKKRSAAQNRWLWGICIQDIKRWLYETKGEVHSPRAIYYYLQTRVLGYDIKSEFIEGKEILILDGKSFSEMTTVEFADAVEKIYLYFAERGLQIRLPKENTQNFITDYE